MTGQTYSRGVLLWIDDRFSGVTAQSGEIWEDIFGTESPRIYRLMDLSLQVAVSFEEAKRTIEELTSAQAAGAFVVCVVDLKIPEKEGGEDQTRYGIRIAQEIQSRNLPFFFLSSNTDASNELHQANLGAVQYYVKQPGRGPWRLPEDLVRMVLNEFRSHVAWISLEDVVESFHEESAIVGTYEKSREPFRNFPFFGPFRDFVWRWETRQQFEIPHVFVVKSAVDHCDEFVQQSLAVLLYQQAQEAPRSLRLYYGKGQDDQHIRNLTNQHVRENNNAVCVIRVHPDQVPSSRLRHLVEEAGLRAGRTIFVLPNDESYDRYTELLQEHRLQVIDELPQVRKGAAPARSELINRTCALVFQRWSIDARLGGDLPLSLGYLAHPELLINPIHWTVLHEAHDVVQTLSDPYEITREVLEAIESLEPRHKAEIRTAVAEQKPVPYRDLLRVGDHIVNQSSETRSRVTDWIERALDEWLNTSWHFPYGLSKQFTGYESASSTAVERCSDERNARSVWRCRHWEEWEDSCYLNLIGMLGEYDDHKPGLDSVSAAPGRRADLARVSRFVCSLGQARFLDKESKIDWEALESLRWPHHRYPLPAAINRRLKQHGRYLWIQPEGLDLASALPMGRIRYRMLASVVEQYSSVLTWGHEVADHLPQGWQTSVRYLTDVVLDHRVAYEWEHNRGTMWYRLLGLVRNGAPLMFVVDQVLRGAPIVGEEGDTTRKFLSEVHGYGKILCRLRGSLGRRQGGYLVPRWNMAGLADNLGALSQMPRLTALSDERSRDLHDTLGNLLKGLLKFGNPSRDSHHRFSARWRDWMSDKALKLTENDGWYSEELAHSEAVPSLWGTKADHLWHAVDAFSLLAHVTYRHRYFDGYHLLAAINDLRVTGKDTCPRVKLPVMETLLEFFVTSLEGLLAQLAFCLELHGERQRAQAIAPVNVSVEPPRGFRRPPPEELEEVQKVRDVDGGYALYTLGIPGRGQVDRFCYHDEESVVMLKAEEKPFVAVS